MAYDPTANEPTKGQTQYDSREIPSGVYLMGPAWLKCPTPKSWKARFEVLMGPFKGASAFVLQGRDTSKEGTRNRLYYYCKSAGLDGVKLETTNDGRITERSLSADVIGHVIKAKVTRKKNGQYVDHDFQAFQDRSEWSSAELDVAKKWEAEFVEKRANETGYGGGGDWGGGGSGSAQGAEDSDQDAPPPDDEWGDGGVW